MKEMDLRIPAKMILAAAILLRIKSNKLVGEDLDALDQLIASSEEEDMPGLFDEDVDHKTRMLEIPELIPKTPQPRKRKVSIYDLVYALEKALEVKHRRVSARMPDMDIILPHRHKDISLIIKNMYVRIIDFFAAHNTHKVTFQALVPANSSKEDKIYSFIPLMFLDHQKRVYIRQEKPFSEIDIYIRNEELIAQFEAEYEQEQELLTKKKKEKAKSKGKTTEAMKGDAKKLKQSKLEKKITRKEQVEHGEKAAAEHEKADELKEIYEDSLEKDFEEPEPEAEKLQEELVDEVKKEEIIKESAQKEVIKVGAIEAEPAQAKKTEPAVESQSSESVEKELDVELENELRADQGQGIKK